MASPLHEEFQHLATDILFTWGDGSKIFFKHIMSEICGSLQYYFCHETILNALAILAWSKSKGKVHVFKPSTLAELGGRCYMVEMKFKMKNSRATNRQSGWIANGKVTKKKFRTEWALAAPDSGDKFGGITACIHRAAILQGMLTCCLWLTISELEMFN